MSTIQDVAKEAGISVSTVSLVLNRKGRISKTTIKRVHQAIENLRFTPQFVGGRTRKHDVYDICVCLPRGSSNPPSTGIYLKWIKSIRNVVRLRGSHTSLFITAPQVDDDYLFQDLIRSKDVNGVILIGQSPSDGYLPYLLKHKIPVVVVNRIASLGEFSYVAIDNFGAGKIVAAYFQKNKHINCAFLGLSLSSNLGFNFSRMAGFEGYLKENKCESPHIFELPKAANTGILNSYFKKISKQITDNGITAVFCSTDSIAISLIDALNEYGVDVPREISVIGVDDSNMKSKTGLRPTSITHDYEDLAQEAVRIMCDLLKKNAKHSCLSSTITTKLNEHDTTAVCRTP